MLFEVRHVTEYSYDAPVRESVMELWMQPRATDRQRLLSFEIDVDPQAQVFSYADCWGNTVHHFDVPHPHERLTTTLRSMVETDAPPMLPIALDMAAWQLLRGESVRGECWDFLHPHGFAIQTDALRAFCEANRVDDLTALDPLTAVLELSGLLYRNFDYEAGVTGADSPIDHALLGARGVCQDFAHIMIAICRNWNIPARYVSGYLHTNQDAGDRSDPDATHAWVEVFLPSLRWVGFDPTNNVTAAERHIAVAVGRDYADVPPSQGVFKGEAESQLLVGVSVRRARTALAEPEFMRMSTPTFQGGRRRSSSAALIDQQHQQQ